MVTGVLPKFKIIGQPLLCEVLMDGEPLRGVVRAEVNLATDELPTLTITLRAQSIDVVRKEFKDDNSS